MTIARHKVYPETKRQRKMRNCFLISRGQFQITTSFEYLKDIGRDLCSRVSAYLKFVEDLN